MEDCFRRLETSLLNGHPLFRSNISVVGQPTATCSSPEVK